MAYQDHAKRKYDDYDGGDMKPEYSGGGGGGSHPAKRKKNGFGGNKKGGSRPDFQPTTMNAVKKRARAIERRFKTGQTLPQNVRHDLERELAHHQHKLAELADDKLRKAMITKYHMVRFFERKKADRLAKQLRTQLDSATDQDNIRRLKADVHTAEIDSLYARNFPHRERYISLYTVPKHDQEEAGEGDTDDGNKSNKKKKPKKKDAGAAAQFLHTERPAVWKEIEALLADQGERALARIRERKPAAAAAEDNGVDDAPEPSGAKSSKWDDDKKSKKGLAGESRAKARGGDDGPGKKPQAQAEKDDDSDGGFFDE